MLFGRARGGGGPPGGRRRGCAGNRPKPLQTGWSAAIRLLLYHRRWLSLRSSSSCDESPNPEPAPGVSGVSEGERGSEGGEFGRNSGSSW
eukprot:9465148-Alexandrium_andersonii.AAC.1